MTDEEAYDLNQKILGKGSKEEVTEKKFRSTIAHLSNPLKSDEILKIEQPNLQERDTAEK